MISHFTRNSRRTIKAHTNYAASKGTISLTVRRGAGFCFFVPDVADQTAKFFPELLALRESVDDRAELRPGALAKRVIGCELSKVHGATAVATGKQSPGRDGRVCVVVH